MKESTLKEELRNCRKRIKSATTIVDVRHELGLLAWVKSLNIKKVADLIEDVEKIAGKKLASLNESELDSKPSLASTIRSSLDS